MVVEKLHSLIVLVVDDHSASHRPVKGRWLNNALFSSELESLPRSCPPRERQYIVSCISRFIDCFSMCLQLTLKTTNKQQIIKDFGLHDDDVIGGMVGLALKHQLEKTVKLFCAWPMARALGETLPKEQKGIHYPFLLGKKVHGFLTCRVSSGGLGRAPRDKVVKLSASVLKLKDCMVEVPDSFVADSFSDYMATLSTVPQAAEDRREAWGKENKVPEGDLEERYESMQEEILASIRYTVGEVFRPVHPSKYKDDEVIPSASSSYSTPRSGGGAWQELVDKTGSSCPLSPPDLLRMDLNQRTGEVIVTYGRPCKLYGEWATDGRRVRARVVPIKEPCKVRWVSIGESQAYYRAKAWNRLVYSQMPQHPTFALTGRPLSVSDVNRMTGKYLLSGDYKGATDTLDPYWSEVVFEEITRVIYRHGDWATRVVGLRSMLTRHELEYRAKGKEPVIFNQENGQLMGSYLSFPILCVLNAAINRLYLDPELSVPISELPLFVNGDDVMMSADHPFTGWESHVGMVGLTPSVGKNYVHTHVCCLNSEFYLRAKGDFQRVYPWSINLCYGQDSDADSGLFGLSVNRPDHLQCSTLGSMAREMVSHQPPYEARLLLSKFILENSKALKSTSRCWWTPEELGGLGLPLNEETVKRVNSLGRLVASFLLTRPRPQDVLMYSPRGSDKYTISCRRWMSACEKLLPTKGYEYRWLPDGAPDAPPPIVKLSDYVGYGSLPLKPEYECRYRQLVKEALKAKGFLTPCNDETLISFSKCPRKAGWIRTNWDPTKVVPELPADELPQPLSNSMDLRSVITTIYHHSWESFGLPQDVSSLPETIVYMD